jgi:hypothetical protein
MLIVNAFFFAIYKFWKQEQANVHGIRKMHFVYGWHLFAVFGIDSAV